MYCGTGYEWMGDGVFVEGVLMNGKICFGRRDMIEWEIADGRRGVNVWVIERVFWNERYE